MKATVQYNDFVGTAAADISDHTDLSRYLEHIGVDVDHYLPVGIRFYSSDYGMEDNTVNFSIICRNSETDKLVEIREDKKQTFRNFISLFKRFNVIVTHKRYLDEELEEETIYITPKEEE